MKSKTLGDLIKPVKPDQVIDQDEFVRVAIERLQTNKTGCICIMDDQKRPIGVFTDGDIRRLVYSDANASLAAVFATKVSKFANHSLKKAPPEMGFKEAAKLMHDLRIGALPVISADGCLLGIINLQDMLGEFIDPQ